MKDENLNDYCGLCGEILHPRHGHDCLAAKHGNRSEAGKKLSAHLHGLGCLTVAEAVAEWINDPACSRTAATILLNASLAKVKSHSRK